MSSPNIARTKLPIQTLKLDLLKLILEDLKSSMGPAIFTPNRRQMEVLFDVYEDCDMEHLELEDMCKMASRYFLNTMENPALQNEKNGHATSNWTRLMSDVFKIE